MALFGNKNTEDNAKDNSSSSVSMQDLYADSSKTVKAGSNGKEGKDSNAYQFIIKPLITEKATNLVAQDKYAFVVSDNANKIAVAKAIKAIYGVKPLKVNLSNVKGKKVSRGKISGQRKDWRKAIVTLPKGQTIKIYEGV